MKMETQVVAPFSGKVRQVMTMPNVQVDTGAPLVQIEAAGSDEAIAPQNRVIFGASQTSPENASRCLPRCRESLQELRQLMLGFDLDPAQGARQLVRMEPELPGAQRRNKTVGERDPQHLCRHLFSVPTRTGSGSSHCRGRTQRGGSTSSPICAWSRPTGKDSRRPLSMRCGALWLTTACVALDGSPKLKESLLWICKSHQRMDQQTTVRSGHPRTAIAAASKPRNHAPMDLFGRSLIA